MENNTPPQVDLVYLWVDGNDPAWRAKHNAAIGITEQQSAVNCEGRYADNDELRFSLRAAELYAPWIRRIFIVTDNQVPSWLDTSHPKVRVVDHSEILPPQSRPCFNSRVIEHCLHRIPDLAEHFLYANDDMFFNRPVTPADFFAPDGLPIIRFNRRPLRKLVLKFREKVLHKHLENYKQTIHNTALLVESRYGKYFGGRTHHNIDAYLKSDYRKVFDEFADVIEPTLVNRMRSANDVQRNIYSYVPLCWKRAHLVYVDRHTSFRLHIQSENHYRKLDDWKPMLFCMNDSQFATDADRRRSTEYLKQRFPLKSSFEIA